MENTLRPFNYEQAKNGKKIVTKDGQIFDLDDLFMDFEKQSIFVNLYYDDDGNLEIGQPHKTFDSSQIAYMTDTTNRWYIKTIEIKN
jgi:hypothetical protein